MKRLIVGLVVLFLLPQSLLAVITFTQLDDDVFVVSHRVKVLGLRGKAMKLVYTKTASLCVAAGFTHMKILEQESETGQTDDVANASIRAQFYLEDGEERVGCERNADPEYVRQAGQKLDKLGYEPPNREASSENRLPPQGSGDAALTDASCTLEQIAAMARAGLTDEQIRKACEGPASQI